MQLSRLKFLLAVMMISALPDCTALRTERPEILYIVKFGEFQSPGSVADCDELAKAIAERASIEVAPRDPYFVPGGGSYCQTVLRDRGNHDEVSLLWDFEALRLGISHYGRMGITVPNAKTMQLADQILQLVKMRYPKAAISHEKSYTSIFGP